MPPHGGHAPPSCMAVPRDGHAASRVAPRDKHAPLPHDLRRQVARPSNARFRSYAALGGGAGCGGVTIFRSFCQNVQIYISTLRRLWLKCSEEGGLNKLWGSGMEKTGDDHGIEGGCDQDTARACYGPRHVEVAHERMAIQTLLITDSLFKNADISARQRYVKLVDSVKDSGGTVHIFSSMHVSGDQLAQISGIAAILRFPLPDLDDIDM
ncbi:hypothetical protein KSP39_PZI021685 [Platanthera zijinensis]|uniref:eRF1 domain-containing protein n=1 Tax=Platanthera zijinensis TaxID=2320716 RepID=A0AAP0AYW5_9ASPA